MKIRGHRAALLLCTGLTACGGTATDGAPPPGPQRWLGQNPAALGPYAVGVIRVPLERTDEDGEPRPVPLEIWYPSTEETAGTASVSYPIRDLVAPRFLAAVGDEALGAIHTSARRDLAIAEDGPFPLVLFSHGNAGVPMQSTFLTVALASHGFIVVAPAHAHNTLYDATALTETTPLTIFPYEDMFQSLLDRPVDLSFVLDQLEEVALDDPRAEAVRKAIAFDQIAIAGHSFGGTTALRFLADDGRAQALVAMSPPGRSITWLLGAVPTDALIAPTLLLAGDLDVVLPPEEATDTLWPDLPAQSQYVRFRTGGHYSFSDFCTLPPRTVELAAIHGLGNAIRNGCAPENVPSAQAHPAIHHLAIAFLNLHLRNDETSRAYLTDEGIRALSLPPEEIVVQRK